MEYFIDENIIYPLHHAMHDGIYLNMDVMRNVLSHCKDENGMELFHEKMKPYYRMFFEVNPVMFQYGPCLEVRRFILMAMEEDEIAGYLAEMSDEDLFAAFRKMIAEQVKMQYAANVAKQMAMMPIEQKAMALDMEAEKYTTKQCASYYYEVLEFSYSTYEKNLSILGYVDLEDPATMNLYTSTFENKDIIEEAIAEYNKNVEEVKQIKYTDYVGIMMSSITTIINAITYILIAFVAISLVVSSIMIAVITLISVQERTKEIGILRAMGASKHNVSVMFNAETILIGFASGALGVIVTVILCFPINAIIHLVTGINSLNAYLPLGAAIILIFISVILNLFSGFIPAKSAARKDPVVALRTE